MADEQGRKKAFELLKKAYPNTPYSFGEFENYLKTDTNAVNELHGALSKHYNMSPLEQFKAKLAFEATPQVQPSAPIAAVQPGEAQADTLAYKSPLKQELEERKAQEERQAQAQQAAAQQAMNQLGGLMTQAASVTPTQPAPAAPESTEAQMAKSAPQNLANDEEEKAVQAGLASARRPRVQALTEEVQGMEKDPSVKAYLESRNSLVDITNKAIEEAKANPTDDNRKKAQAFAIETKKFIDANKDIQSYIEGVDKEFKTLDPKEVEGYLKKKEARQLQELAKKRREELAKKGVQFQGMGDEFSEIPGVVEPKTEDDKNRYAAMKEYQRLIDFPLEDKGMVDDFLKGVKSAIETPSFVPYLGDAQEAVLDTRVQKIMDKKEGKRTEDETDLLDAYSMAKQVADDPELQRFWYRAAKGATAMAPYAFEFYLFGGIYSGLKRLAQKGAVKMLGKEALRELATETLKREGVAGMKSFGKRLVAESMTSVPAAAIQSLANPVAIAKEIQRRMMDTQKMELGQGGDVERREIIASKAAQDPGATISKVLLSRVAEFATERMGVPVEKLGSAISKGIASRYLKARGISATGKALDKLADRVAFHGPFGETSEEVINAYLSSLIEKGELEGMSKEQLLDTFAVVTIPSVFGGALRAPGAYARGISQARYNDLAKKVDWTHPDLKDAVENKEDIPEPVLKAMADVYPAQNATDEKPAEVPISEKQAEQPPAEKPVEPPYIPEGVEPPVEQPSIGETLASKFKVGDPVTISAIMDADPSFQTEGGTKKAAEALKQMKAEGWVDSDGIFTGKKAPKVDAVANKTDDVFVDLDVLRPLGKKAIVRAKHLEDYKGRKIVDVKGRIQVYDPEKKTLFIPSLDDSKESGDRKFIEEANNVETAKQYIDWLTSDQKTPFKSPVGSAEVVPEEDEGETEGEDVPPEDIDDEDGGGEEEGPKKRRKDKVDEDGPGWADHYGENLAKPVWDMTKEEVLSLPAAEEYKASESKAKEATYLKAYRGIIQRRLQRGQPVDPKVIDSDEELKKFQEGFNKFNATGRNVAHMTESEVVLRDDLFFSVFTRDTTAGEYQAQLKRYKQAREAEVERLESLLEHLNSQLKELNKNVPPKTDKEATKEFRTSASNLESYINNVERDIETYGVDDEDLDENRGVGFEWAHEWSGFRDAKWIVEEAAKLGLMVNEWELAQELVNRMAKAPAGDTVAEILTDIVNEWKKENHHATYPLSTLKDFSVGDFVEDVSVQTADQNYYIENMNDKTAVLVNYKGERKTRSIDQSFYYKLADDKKAWLRKQLVDQGITIVKPKKSAIKIIKESEPKPEPKKKTKAKEQKPVEKPAEKPVEKPVEDPAKPTDKTTQAEKELDDLFDEFDDLFGQENPQSSQSLLNQSDNQSPNQSISRAAQSPRITPELLTAGVKIVEKLTEIGVYEFPDLVGRAIKKMGLERVRQVLPALKQAYAAFSATAPDDIVDKLTDSKEVRGFDLTKYTESHILGGSETPKGPKDEKPTTGSGTTRGPGSGGTTQGGGGDRQPGSTGAGGTRTGEPGSGGGTTGEGQPLPAPSPEGTDGNGGGSEAPTTGNEPGPVKGESPGTGEGNGEGTGRSPLPEAGPVVNGGSGETSQPLVDASKDFRANLEDTKFGKASLASNMEAIRILNTLKEEKRDATEDEKKKLARYAGWGAFKSIFNDTEFNRINIRINSYGWNPETAIENSPWGKKYYKHAQELRSLLTQDEYLALSKSTANAHYTDPQVIQSIWRLIEHLGFKGGTVLEPAMGTGQFFSVMPEELRNATKILGVELEPIAAKIAQVLYPSSDVQAKGLQDATFAEYTKAKNPFVGFADLVISNVPFGSQPVHFSKSDAKSYGSFNRDINNHSIHNQFIIRGLDALRPGGLMVVISTSWTMDAEQQNSRKEMMKRADLVGAIRLPNDAFTKQAKTEVTTDILIFRKKTTGANFEHPKVFTSIANHKVVKNEAKEPVTIRINEYFHANQNMMLGEMRLSNQLDDDGNLVDSGGGLYSGNTQTLAGKNDGRSLAQKILDSLENIPAGIAKEGAIGKAGLKASTELKNDALVVGENGELYQNYNGRLGTPSFVFKLNDNGSMVDKTTGEPTDDEEKALRARGWEKKVEAGKAYVPVRLKLIQLLGAELNPDLTDEQIDELRADLNRSYDDYVTKFGAFNSIPSRFLEVDPEYYAVASLEEEIEELYDEKKGKKTAKRTRKAYVKRGILLGRVRRPFAEPDIAGTLDDAINIALSYHGFLDIPYMSELLSKTEEEVSKELEANPTIFRNPQSDLLEIGGTYLSGNVREKLHAAEAAAATNPVYQRNVDALKTVLPEWVTLNIIDLKLGANYVDPKAYSEFISNILGTTIEIGYNAISRSFQLNTDRDHIITDKNLRTYAAIGYVDGHDAGSRSGIEIFMDALNHRPSIVKVVTGLDDEGRPIHEVDREATSRAGEIRERFEEMFKPFMMGNEFFKNSAEQVYNETRNSYAEKKPHVPAWEHYPGADINITLDPHQRIGVAKALNGCVGFFHYAGSGKTYTMATLAMEARRLGVARKPLITVLNSTVEQFSAQFKKLYPGANILVPNKRQMEKDNRKRLIAQIATNDYDAVIIPESFLGLIPDDKERLVVMIAQEVEKVKAEIESLMTKEGFGPMDIVETLKNASLGKKARRASQELKDLVRMYRATLKRMKDASDRKTDDLLNFEQLGIDMLMLDEAHEYKSVPFATSRGPIKGVDTKFSQRAFSAYTKTRFVQEQTGGKNVVLATGTPVTNTMAEAWTMLRFLMPEELEKAGIDTFDEFVTNFGDVSAKPEYSQSGEYQIVTRFRGFINVPEFIRLWKTVADVIIDEDVQSADKPNRAPFDDDYVVLKQTPGLRRVINKIRRDLRDFEQSTNKKWKRANSHIPMTAFGKSRKASVDIRLVDPTLPDFKGSKANVCVERVYDIWKNEGEKHYSKQIPATQLIFCDLFNGDRKFNVNDRVKVTIREKVYNAVTNEQSEVKSFKFGTVEGFRPAEIVAKDRVFELPGASILLDANEKGEQETVTIALRDVEFEDKKKDNAINIFEDIRKKLIAKGIPEAEIVVVDEQTGDEREQLFEDANNGKVRVLLGSSWKLGTGVNVQRFAFAEHNLDATLVPKDLEQRTKRVVRRGNIFATDEFKKDVHVFLYGVEKTLDGVIFDKNLIKQKGIDQLLRGNINERYVPDFFSEIQLSTEEITASLTGDKRRPEMLSYERKLRELENRRDQILNAAVTAKRDIAQFEKNAEDAKAWLEFYKKSKTEVEASFPLRVTQEPEVDPQGKQLVDKDGKPVFKTVERIHIKTLEFDGKTLTTEPTDEENKEIGGDDKKAERFYEKKRVELRNALNTFMSDLLRKHITDFVNDFVDENRDAILAVGTGGRQRIYETLKTGKSVVFNGQKFDFSVVIEGEYGGAEVIISLARGIKREGLPTVVAGIPIKYSDAVEGSILSWHAKTADDKNRLLLFGESAAASPSTFFLSTQSQVTGIDKAIADKQAKLETSERRVKELGEFANDTFEEEEKVLYLRKKINEIKEDLRNNPQNLQDYQKTWENIKQEFANLTTEEEEQAYMEYRDDIMEAINKDWFVADLADNSLKPQQFEEVLKSAGYMDQYELVLQRARAEKRRRIVEKNAEFTAFIEREDILSNVVRNAGESTTEELIDQLNGALPRAGIGIPLEKYLSETFGEPLSVAVEVFRKAVKDYDRGILNQTEDQVDPSLKMSSPRAMDVISRQPRGPRSSEFLKNSSRDPQIRRANIRTYLKRVASSITVADVRVVDNQSDLPSELVEKYRGENIDGAAVPPVSSRDKWTVWIVANNMRDESHAFETVMHEIVGHVGLRGVIGAQFDSFMDQIWKEYGQQIRREPWFEAYARTANYNPKTPRGQRRLAEEFIAYTAQSYREPSLLQKVMDKLREIWKNMLGETSISDFQIRRVIAASMNYVQQRAADTIGKSAARFSESYAMYAGKKASGFENYKTLGETFTGHDMMDRFEFSDKKADVITPEEFQNKLKTAPNSLRLGDILIHPALYTNYPILKDVRIVLDRDRFSLGFFHPVKKIIGISPDLSHSELRSVLLHEVQHYIQNVEGFAPGGNTGLVLRMLRDRYEADFIDDSAYKALKENNLKDGKIVPAFEGMIENSEINYIIKRTAEKRGISVDDLIFEGYELLAGEVEARDVQERRDMSNAERRATPPLQLSLDKSNLSRDKMIVRIASSDAFMALSVGNAKERIDALKEDIGETIEKPVSMSVKGGKMTRPMEILDNYDKKFGTEVGKAKRVIDATEAFQSKAVTSEVTRMGDQLLAAAKSNASTGGWSMLAPVFNYRAGMAVREFLKISVPLAAHLNAVRRDNATGEWEFQDFQMRAGTMSKEEFNRLQKDLGVDVGDEVQVTNMLLTRAKAIRAANIAGKKGKERKQYISRYIANYPATDARVIGDLITLPDGREAYQLLRDVSADMQREIYEQYQNEYPMFMWMIDYFIDPALRGMSRMVDGFQIPVFNRFSLAEFYNLDNNELEEIAGYTPDVALTRGLVGFFKELGNQLRAGVRSPGRRYKTGTARESGNVKDLLAGFQNRAFQVIREKSRKEFAAAILKSAKEIPVNANTPPGWVPFETGTRLIYDSVRRVQTMSFEPYTIVVPQDQADEYEADPTKLPRNTVKWDPDTLELTLRPFFEVYNRMHKEGETNDELDFKKFLGEAYRLVGKRFMLPQAVIDVLVKTKADHIVRDGLMAKIDWIARWAIRNTTQMFLAHPQTYMGNIGLNELFTLTAVTRHALAGMMKAGTLSSPTHDLRMAKNLLAVSIRGRFIGLKKNKGKIASSIKSILPDELFEGGTLMRDAQVDPNAKWVDSFARGEIGAGTLQLMRYGNIDVRAKQRFAYAFLLTKATDEAKKRGYTGQDVKNYVNSYMSNPPIEDRVDALTGANFEYLNYANTPDMLERFSNNEYGRLLLMFPRFGYHFLAKQKDGLKHLITFYGGKDKDEKISRLAHGMTTALIDFGLGGILLAYLGFGPDDEPRAVIGSSEVIEKDSPEIRAMAAQAGIDQNTPEYRELVSQYLKDNPDAEAEISSRQMDRDQQTTNRIRLHRVIEQWLRNTGMGNDEQMFWLRVRNYPMIMMVANAALAAQDARRLGASYGAQAYMRGVKDLAFDFFSIGGGIRVGAKLLQSISGSKENFIDPYGSNVPLAFYMTEAAMQTFIPGSRQMDEVMLFINPNTKRKTQTKSLDYNMDITDQIPNAIRQEHVFGVVNLILEKQEVLDPLPNSGTVQTVGITGKAKSLSALVKRMKAMELLAEDSPNANLHRDPKTGKPKVSFVDNPVRETNLMQTGVRMAGANVRTYNKKEYFNEIGVTDKEKE